MKNIFIIGLALLLVGCGEPFEYQVCQKALDGVWSNERYEACVKEANEAHFQAVHKVAQKYRDLPR